MHNLQQGEFLFSYLVQPENEVGMSLPAIWGPYHLGQPLVPANTLPPPSFLQWDNIQELLGHPVEKPVVLHR